MLFNSFLFVVFFAVVYTIYRLLPHKQQNVLLLTASYIFYMSWDWRFISLIFLSTIIDYYCGPKIHETTRVSLKKFYVSISVISNLVILGFFKYFNFFAENLVSLTSLFGWHPGEVTLNIVLPVGISFYIFQTMSYSIDIFRNEVKPEYNFINFALFVSFFPQLVAGPIERAKNLLPQIQQPRIVTESFISTGVWMIAWGFFLKIFIADNMGLLVDHTFAKSGVISGAEVLLATYAFAFQIFGDFAGYSSIAIGIASLMGIRLSTNFLFPYFVTNPADFWKNWHISLSSWLRDYLYIPLGGSRNGEVMLYRNLFLTMLLGGIWHGAAWTFVIWGIYQGGILIIHRLFSPYVSGLFPGSEESSLRNNIIHAGKVVFMFQVTCLGWLIFRADSMAQLSSFTQSLLFNMGAYAPELSYFLFMIVFMATPLLFIQIYQIRFGSKNSLAGFPAAYRYGIYLMIFYAIVIFGEYGSREFIYFQF